VLYQLRLRQVARQFNMRMEERVNERTRIARDLHDTMLQSFHAVLLKLSVTASRVKDPPEAREQLAAIVEQARQAVSEGREAVQGLRSSTVTTNELAQAIRTLGEELAADPKGAHGPEVRVYVEGTTRDLAPIVRDEVYRIACEAVRNAFRHAQAAGIEVEIQYGERQFRLCGTTARASTRRSWRPAAVPDIMDCQECGNGPRWREESWRFLAGPVPARRLS